MDDGSGNESFEDGDVIATDGSTSISELFTEDNFTGGADIEGIHVFTSNGTLNGISYSTGDLLITTDNDEILTVPGGSNLTVEEEDVILVNLDNMGAITGASVVLDGSAFGLSDSDDENIDAVSFFDGNLFISLENDETFNSTDFDDGDIIQVTFGGGGTITTSLLFDESDALADDIFDAGIDFDIDGVHVLSADEFIITTEEDAGLAGTTAELQDGDLLFVDKSGGSVSTDIILDEDNFFGNGDFNIDAVDPTRETIDAILAIQAANDASRAVQSQQALVQTELRSIGTSMAATAAFGAMMVNFDEMGVDIGNNSVSSSDGYVFAGTTTHEMVALESLGEFESASFTNITENGLSSESVNTDGKFGDYDTFTNTGITAAVESGAGDNDDGGVEEFLSQTASFGTETVPFEALDASGSMMEALLALTPEGETNIELAEAAGLVEGNELPELAAIMDDIMAEQAIDGMLDQISGPINEFVGMDSENGYLGNDTLAGMIETGAFAFEGGTMTDMTEEAAVLATMSA